MKHTSIFPNCIQSMVAFLLIFTVAFSACEKKSDVGTDHSELKLQAKQIALSRIESKKQHATKEGIEKLDKLIAGLEFENMWIEKESDSTNIIVIPAKIGFETLSKLGNRPAYQLILVVNKWNGVNRENIVAFIPDNTGESLSAKGSFPAVLNKRKGAADGRYIFMNFSGSYFYSLNYENGYLKQAGTPLKKTASELDARTETETICIEWWHVTYYYDENGYFLYKDEEYLYQTCHSCGEITPWGQTMVCDYLDDGTGGGGGGEVDISKYFDCLSVSEMGAVSTISESLTRRTKTYSWIFVKNTFGLWHYNSIETGVHKKVGNTWQWDSLTHTAISRYGIAIMAVLECTINTSTPQIGIYNAGMQLNYSVTGSAMVQNAPISVVFNSSANSPIWNANN